MYRYRIDIDIERIDTVPISILIRSIYINIRHDQAEAGNLVFMEDGIEMDTSTGGGASSMFRRSAVVHVYGVHTFDFPMVVIISWSVLKGVMSDSMMNTC